MVALPESWQLNGKIAVQTAQDSGSATILWIENHDRYNVSLYGPLGTQGLKLTGQPGHVTLITADGKRFIAESAEQLLAENWGFHLPLSNLRYWIRGLPVPGIPHDSRFDNQHRLIFLNQQGWRVEFQDYVATKTIDLPNKLLINSATLKTKIVIYQWKI